MIKNCFSRSELFIKITYLLLSTEDYNQDEKETITPEHDGMDKNEVTCMLVPFICLL